MQPTLAAFLKRTAAGSAAASGTVATSSVVTRASTVVSSSSSSSRKNEKGEDIIEEQTQKKVKLTVEERDEEAGETATVVAQAETDSAAVQVKDESQVATVSSKLTTSSVAVATTQALTWVDAEIERLEDEKWKSILKKEAQKARPLFMFLNKLPDSKILPPKSNVFEAFRLCPFDQVKVVILGQDPYHGPKQAHGLAFSVMRDVPIPPSLKNIFKEATNDVGAKNGKHGNLEAWAKQGVLLLNALLTVEAGTPMAHKGRGWEKFTDDCIAALAKERSNLVFMLWGKPAQEKGKIVDRKKHLVITSSHPSPLGASQTSEPFLGSKCFSRCNDYLKKNGLGEINWDVV